MNLFQYDQRIMECFDAETGEVFDAEAFNQLMDDRDEKIKNIALYIKDLEANAEALKNIKAEYAARQASAEHKALALRNYLQKYLDGAKVERPEFKISYRKSEQVQISSDALLPDEYLTFEAPKPNKTAIKAALKAGTELEGCSLITNTNMQIK